MDEEEVTDVLPSFNYEVGELSGSYVRIWDDTRPVGMGFLVDPQHIMTCAHVVGDALGNRSAWANAPAPVNQAILFEFVCRPVRSRDELSSARVVAEAWRPQEGLEKPADVAVLRIDEGVISPSRTSVIRTCQRTYVRDDFTALGIKQGLPGGTYVVGKFAGELSDERIEVIADRLDVAIRPGCSGSAVWNLTRRGVAGMIVELQTETQGRIIPIKLLRELWPRMDEENGATTNAESATYRSRLSQRLSAALHTFDRTRQTADFELALDEFWDARRSPVVCAILGSQDDRPTLCRDRCLRLSLRDRLERIELGGKPPRQKQIDWPSFVNRGASYVLSNLKQQVRSELKARDASANAIRMAYNNGVTPWAFFSIFRGSEFTTLHREVLREWIEFWRQVGTEALNKPLAVLLILQLTGKQHEDALLELAFDDFGQAPFEFISRLDRLHAFEREEVIDWLQDNADELAIHVNELNGVLLPEARKSLGKEIRLAALEDWIHSLPV